jgi:hypothetical protein
MQHLALSMEVAGMTQPPNTRVQRTRSSPSARRSPLTRRPLGRQWQASTVLAKVDGESLTSASRQVP